MSAVRAPAIRFFERELFFSSFVIKWTNRRISIGPTKYYASNDLDARTERDRIGGKPARFVHGTEYFFLASDEPDIDGIAWDAFSSSRHHGQEGKARLVLVMGPQGGQHDIGKHQVGNEHANQSNPPSPICKWLHALLS